MERKWSFEYEDEEQYSLDFCYDYLETKLKEDDFSMLQTALLMGGE